MFRPKSTRRNGICFDASIAPIAFEAEISREAVELQELLLGQAVELRQRAHEAESHRRRTSCSPTPSMSAAACTQLISDSRPREGHARFGQRCIASPSGLTTAVPQSGHARHPERLRAATVLAGRPDDLRDHVAGALHDHVVALADLLAVDVLLVVQRRARDGDAADLDRLAASPTG